MHFTLLCSIDCLVCAMLDRYNNCGTPNLSIIWMYMYMLALL